MMKQFFGFILFIFVYFLSGPVHAKEFRDIHRLNKPSSAEKEGYGKIIKPLEKSVVEAAVGEVFSKYNTPDFGSLLADSFYNKNLLTNAVDSKVPRDATIRVLGMQGMETMGQTIQSRAGSNSQKLVSIVSVTVKAQMEFNNSSGFQRREGTNELLLKITQDAP